MWRNVIIVPVKDTKQMNATLEPHHIVHNHTTGEAKPTTDTAQNTREQEATNSNGLPNTQEGTKWRAYSTITLSGKRKKLISESSSERKQTNANPPGE
jgi:hypothetical protein